jgi:chromosome segregation ATPase
MARICRKIVRVGVIGALGVGTAALVAEAASPGSARAIARQAKQNVRAVIHDRIDDPVALREQLRSLEAQYPERIDAVRGDLTELQGQMAQFRHELAVTERVVALAEQDLGQMQHLLSRAEDARSKNGFAVVRVRHGTESLDMGEAYAKAERIRQLKEVYAARAGEIRRDMGFLGEQESRLSDLLTTLETERAEFQSQLWQLDRQIDAVARNERMLTMLEKRQRTLDQTSPFAADSLEQVTGRIAQIRAEQEARMESLTSRRYDDDILNRARVQVDADAAGNEAFHAELDSLEVGPDMPVLPGARAN